MFNLRVKAEDSLARAVKLDPNLTEAWNALGECYWKKGDITGRSSSSSMCIHNGSKNCFVGALTQKKTKESLRNLSIVLRQVPGEPAVRKAAIVESVERAKEAVALDVPDGLTHMFI